ncbi:MAG TPA: M28 family peptidase [Chthonomonadales bacterium]|nr:M28 family peptidase [Chthonomonadales bacterium]
MIRTARRGLAVALLLLLAASAGAQFPGARPAPAAWRAGLESITEADARGLVTFLAGPDFRGRSAVLADYAAAAGFAAGLFREAGLKPAAQGGSYFQRFALARYECLQDQCAIDSADGRVRLAGGVDFAITRSPVSSRDVRGELVFARLAGDGAPLDARQIAGKVLIVRNDTSDPLRVEALRTDAPALILTVSGDLRGAAEAAASAPLTVVPMGRAPEEAGAPVGRIRRTVAESLARTLGAQAFLSPSTERSSLEPSGLRVTVSLTVREVDRMDQMNVAALLPGTDPALAGEFVVVGGHLDHLGLQPGGVVFPGADDNASGAAGTLLVARAMALNPRKPRRSVLFVLWAAEERGLLGSTLYMEEPLAPVERTVAYLNMDMIGRHAGDEPENARAIALLGSEATSPDLHRLMLSLNQHIGFEIKPASLDATDLSDCKPFKDRGVPVAFAFTDLHPDYHTAGDTPDKVDARKVANAAKWVLLAASELASRPDRPRFRRP